VLRAKVVELKRQVGQDFEQLEASLTSSDGLAKPGPRSLRRKSGRKPGGQKGHPGSTLAQVADPDEVLRHEPGVCAGCGGGLAGAPEVDAGARGPDQLHTMNAIKPRDEQRLSKEDE
jgi:hypothetical protein